MHKYYLQAELSAQKSAQQFTISMGTILFEVINFVGFSSDRIPFGAIRALPPRPECLNVDIPV